MPKVPTYDSLQVSPGSLPVSGVQGIQPPRRAMVAPVARIQPLNEAPNVAAQQAQNAGNAAQDFGGALMDMSTDMRQEELQKQAQMEYEQEKLKQELDQVAVSHAKNTVTGKSYQMIIDAQQRKGWDAVNPNERGESLMTQYGNQWDGHADEAAKGLQNDEQRREFSMWRETAKNQLSERIFEHVARETQGVAKSTAVSGIEHAIDGVALAGVDPQRLGEQLDAIRVNTAKAGNLNGETPQQIDYKTKNNISKAVVGSIGNAIRNDDAATASGLMTMADKEGWLTPEDSSKARHAVNQYNSRNLQYNVSESVYQQFLPRLAPSNEDRAIEVMTPEGKPEDIARFKAAFAEGKGDFMQAWGLYRLGKEKVGELEQDAKSRNLPSWTDAMSDKDKQAMNADMSAWEAKTNAIGNLPTQAEQDAMLEQTLKASGWRGDPETFDRARDRLRSRLAITRQEILRKNDETVSQKAGELEKIGGDITKVDVSMLPKDDQIKLVRYGKLLRDHAGDVDDETNLKNYAQWESLTKDEKRAMTPAQVMTTYMGKVKPDVVKGMIRENANLRDEANDKDKRVFSDSEIMKKTLVDAQLLPAEGSYNKKESALWMRMQREVQVRIDELRARPEHAGKDLTWKEVEDISRDIVKRTATTKNWGFESTKPVIAMSPDEIGKATAQMSDIPTLTQSKIITLLKEQNIPVTNDNMVWTYNQMIKGGSNAE